MIAATIRVLLFALAAYTIPACATTTSDPTTTVPTSAPTTAAPTAVQGIVATYNTSMYTTSTDSEDGLARTVLLLAAAVVAAVIIVVGVAAAVCCCCMKTGNAKVSPSKSAGADVNNDSAAAAKYNNRPSTAEWKEENMPAPPLSWSTSWTDLVGDDHPSAGDANHSMPPIRGRSQDLDRPIAPRIPQPQHQARIAKVAARKGKSNIIMPAARMPTPTVGVMTADSGRAVAPTTLPILR